MTDYKLVPVEMALPCPFCGSSNIGNKYIETYSTDSSYDTFGCKDCGARFEDGCQDDWNRRAAPAVRGEPVAWRYRMLSEDWEAIRPSHPSTFHPDHEKLIIEPLYLAPQPAEQQSPADDSLTPIPDELFAAEFAAWWEEHGQLCRAGGGNYERSFAFEAWRHLYPQLMNLQLAAVEQKPAADVAWSEDADTDSVAVAEAIQAREDAIGQVHGLRKQVAQLVGALSGLVRSLCIHEREDAAGRVKGTWSVEAEKAADAALRKQWGVQE